MFLNLKNLFSHCFSTFFPFHKLRLCSYIGKFWHNYVIRIKTNKKTPFIPIPAYYIPLNFPTPLFINPPPPDNFIRAWSHDIPSACQHSGHAENRVFIRESPRSRAYTAAQVSTSELHRPSLFEMPGHACRFLNRKISRAFSPLWQRF